MKERGVCWAEPIVKRLGHICPLCPSFKPHMHDGKNGTPNRLMEAFSFKKPAVITPVSTGDLFGLYPYQTDIVLTKTREAKQHIFALLTKLPQNACRLSPFDRNIYFGVTVNQQSDVWRLEELKKIQAPVKYTLFEPLYSAIDYDLSFLDWIVIGPQTRPDLQPRDSWIQSVLDNAGDTPIFMKTTLEWSPKQRQGPVA